MMQNHNGFLWEVAFWQFFFITVVLAGAAACLTGRASARTWQSNLSLGLSMGLLAAATRFIHFALFGGTLLSLHYYAVDLIVLLLLAFTQKGLTRIQQMSTQYSFFSQRKGLVSWGPKLSALPRER